MQMMRYHWAKCLLCQPRFHSHIVSKTRIEFSALVGVKELSCIFWHELFRISPHYRCLTQAANWSCLARIAVETPWKFNFFLFVSVICSGHVVSVTEVYQFNLGFGGVEDAAWQHSGPGEYTFTFPVICLTLLRNCSVPYQVDTLQRI